MLRIKENALGMIVQREFFFFRSVTLNVSKIFLAGKINDLNKMRVEHEDLKAILQRANFIWNQLQRQKVK